MCSQTAADLSKYTQTELSRLLLGMYMVSQACLVSLSSSSSDFAITRCLDLLTGSPMPMYIDPVFCSDMEAVHDFYFVVGGWSRVEVA